MLTPYLPYPPSSGGQIRSYNLIKYLAKDNEITLFSLIKNESEKEHVKELQKYCKSVKVFNRSSKPWTIGNILKTGFSLYPFVVVRNLSKDQQSALVEELKNEKYDLIHAETFYVMPHLPETKIPVILVDQTIEFQVYQHFVEKTDKWYLKPLLYIDVLKIKYWELNFWRKAKKVIAVSEVDKKKMVSLVKGINVAVVPNGAGEELMGVWKKRKPEKDPIIFFQANFDWMQNIEAAQNLALKVFPLVKKKNDKARCWIVGQGAKERVGKLESKDIKIINLENSDINGVIDSYRKATVFAAPLEGPGGTRLKILAAMAAGVPVVSSKVGIEGIDAQDEKEVLIAQNWEDMAKKIISLIENKELYHNLVVSARKLVEEKYSYKRIAETLDGIYKEVANARM